MSELGRLREETSDPLERALLEEARDYGASPTARANVLAAVATAGAPPSSPWPALVKIGLGVAVVAAIAATLAWPRAHTNDASLAPSNSATMPASAMVPSGVADTSSAPTPTPTPTLAPTPTSTLTLAPTPTSISSGRTSAPASSASNGTLAEEVAAIDRARRAVYASDKEGAARALDDYERRFPKGVLAPEARRLRERARALP